MDAPILRIVAQRHPNDCSIACLAMLCGVSYENALVAMASDEPNVCVRGAKARDIRRAAKRLGFALRSRRRFDLESDTGILNVSSPEQPNDHLVVLKDGLIFDTDLTVWDADVYLSANRARAGSLYTVEKRAA